MFISCFKKNIKAISLILLGSFILAFGTYNFNYQNNVTEGGILGLLLFFKNIFDISPSITSLVLDLSLFVVGMRFFGKRFLVLSVLCTTSFSFFYQILERFPPLIPSLTEYMLLASILAGIFVGVGVGLVVIAGGASGGDDVLALIISKLTPLKMNHVYLISDLSVLLLSLTYLKPEQLIWSLIAVTLSGKIISLLHSFKDDASCASS